VKQIKKLESPRKKGFPLSVSLREPTLVAIGDKLSLHTGPRKKKEGGGGGTRVREDAVL